MAYLATLPSRWRLEAPAHHDNKAVNLKVIIVAECAAELSNWSKGLRASIRALIHLYPISSFAAIGQQSSYSGWPKDNAALRLNQQSFGPLTSMNQGGINAPLTGIKLPTIGWVVVALVN